MGNQEHIHRVNIKIASGFEYIEKKLGQANHIVELFELLVSEVEAQFQVPFVWLTLVDNEKSAVVIDAVKSSAMLKERLNTVSSVFYKDIFAPGGNKPVLVNDRLNRYFRLLPSNRKYFVKSMALVPFRIGDDIRGSWNNADASPHRYLPEMETTLLQTFAQSLSDRLTSLMLDGKFK